MVEKNTKIQIVHKQWGKEEYLQVNPHYSFKKITIYENQSLPYHYHVTKEETWYIAKGYGIAKLDEEIFEINEGDVIHLTPNVKHSLLAIKEICIIEASTTFLTDSIRV